MIFVRNVQKVVPEAKQPWDFSELRDRFKKALQEAIDKNDKYNILSDGTPAKSVGEIKLYQTNRGGSLIVGIIEKALIGSYLPDGKCGQVVIQLDFGPEHNVIHITFGDLYYLTIIVSNEPKIDGAAKMVSEKVADYRLFKE